jgi:hypothetical protein
MTQMIARLFAPLFLAAACSGSSGGAGDATTPTNGEGQTTEPTPEEESEAKLRAAQDSAIEAMCERFYHCAVEDTPPDKQAEVGNPEELESTHRADCEEAYGRSNLSPRQIKIIQRCVNEAQKCDALNECLAEASKK